MAVVLIAGLALEAQAETSVVACGDAVALQLVPFGRRVTQTNVVWHIATPSGGQARSINRGVVDGSGARSEHVSRRCRGYAGVTNGGSTGIRTLEELSPLHTFQACAFDHSATDPCAAAVAWRAARRQGVAPAGGLRDNAPEMEFRVPDIAIRTDWTRAEAAALFDLPFADLMWQAQGIHRAAFAANEVQFSTLLSIKTGGCPEDCGYCSQSAKWGTGVAATRLLDVDAVLASAAAAKTAGAQRFCMGAAWRGPADRHVPALVAMVEGVKALGLETCMTLGMLSDYQAGALAAAGLDYYNHNLDTSPEHYGKIITTRTYADRLDTLAKVREAGINVCCGGIIGMGESRADRIGLLVALATLPAHPGSVPINALVPIAGTPRGDAMLAGEKSAIDGLEFVRTVAVARIMMPLSVVRLSAGREAMSDECQALCLLAGANSLFVGNRLLTTSNPEADRDAALFARLGIVPMTTAAPATIAA